jgi:hypothetical protein
MGPHRVARFPLTTGNSLRRAAGRDQYVAVWIADTIVGIEKLAALIAANLSSATRTNAERPNPNAIADMPSCSSRPYFIIVLHGVINRRRV